MVHLIMKFIIKFITVAAVAASSTELVRSFAKKYGTQSHLLVLFSVTNWLLSLIYQEVSYSYYGCSGSCNATEITEWAKKDITRQTQTPIECLLLQYKIQFSATRYWVWLRDRRNVFQRKWQFILCPSSFWMPLQWRRSKVWWHWRKVGRILHHRLLRGKRGNLLWWHAYAVIVRTDLEWRVSLSWWTKQMRGDSWV